LSSFFDVEEQHNTTARLPIMPKGGSMMNRSRFRFSVTLSWLAIVGAAAIFVVACRSELTAPTDADLATPAPSSANEALVLSGSNGQLGAIRSLESSTSSAGVFRGFRCQVTPDGLTTYDSVAAITSSGGETLYCSGRLSEAPGGTTVQKGIDCALYSRRPATRSVLTISSRGVAVLSCSL
jgi:hypothetical protein